MYNKNIHRRYTININKEKFDDVIKKLESEENITAYIIKLIKNDIISTADKKCENECNKHESAFSVLLDKFNRNSKN